MAQIISERHLSYPVKFVPGLPNTVAIITTVAPSIRPQITQVELHLRRTGMYLKHHLWDTNKAIERRNYAHYRHHGTRE